MYNCSGSQCSTDDTYPLIDDSFIESDTTLIHRMTLPFATKAKAWKKTSHSLNVAQSDHVETIFNTRKGKCFGYGNSGCR